MEKEIKQINIVLENCEILKIKYIDVLELKVMDKISCNYYDNNEEYPQYEAGYLYLKISSKANKKYHIFGKKEYAINIFDRLNDYQDIVCIEFIDSNDKIIEEIYASYMPLEILENNPFQKSNINKDYLEIEICDRDKYEKEIIVK